MNLENNKFSTIRKAIQGRAEKEAEEASPSDTKEQHYKESFDFYKKIKKIKPERMGKFVSLYAERKELKEKIGGELYQVFNQRWEEVTKGTIEKMLLEAGNLVEEYYHKKLKLPHNLFMAKMNNFNKKLLDAKAEILRKDPIIIYCFKGKENLLEEAIDYTINAIILETQDNFIFS